MVLARFLWRSLEKKAPRKSATNREWRRKATRNREIVDGKVFASDENFTNCILMRYDGFTLTKDRGCCILIVNKSAIFVPNYTKWM